MSCNPKEAKGHGWELSVDSHGCAVLACINCKVVADPYRLLRLDELPPLFEDWKNAEIAFTEEIASLEQAQMGYGPTSHDDALRALIDFPESGIFFSPSNKVTSNAAASEATGEASCNCTRLLNGHEPGCPYLLKEKK